MTPIVPNFDVVTRQGGKKRKRQESEVGLPGPAFCLPGEREKE